MAPANGSLWCDSEPMYALIYFPERLPVGLDVIEDEIEAKLADAGEVTGTGTGERGSNIDVIFDAKVIPVLQMEEILREVIGRLGIKEQPKITFVNE